MPQWLPTVARFDTTIRPQAAQRPRGRIGIRREVGQCCMHPFLEWIPSINMLIFFPGGVTLPKKEKRSFRLPCSVHLFYVSSCLFGLFLRRWSTCWQTVHVFNLIAASLFRYYVRLLLIRIIFESMLKVGALGLRHITCFSLVKHDIGENTSA